MKNLLIVLTLLFFSSINAQTDNYYKNLSLANESHKISDYDKTIVYSLRCLSEKPKDFAALYFLHNSYHFLDKFDISNEYGNEILKLPSNEKDKTMLPIVLYYQGLNYYFLDQKEIACNFFRTSVLTMGEQVTLTLNQAKFIQDNCR